MESVVVLFDLIVRQALADVDVVASLEDVGCPRNGLFENVHLDPARDLLVSVEPVVKKTRIGFIGRPAIECLAQIAMSRIRQGYSRVVGGGYQRREDRAHVHEQGGPIVRQTARGDIRHQNAHLAGEPH